MVFNTAAHVSPVIQAEMSMMFVAAVAKEVYYDGIECLIPVVLLSKNLI